MADPVHILITGGSGQIGLELQSGDWPEIVRLHAPTRASLDLESPASVRAFFGTIPFAAVINSGAHTAVDRAESEVIAAFAANAMGPAVLAEVTHAAQIPLIQISTDYVFDGRKDTPYNEEDPVAPLGVYGASKLAGELAVRNGNPRSIVLRTAWVVSVHRANFLKTMLRLASDRPAVRVVDDQTGCPTSARDIAAALKTITLKMIADRDAPAGVYHFANGGETSWAGLARRIFALSEAAGGPFAAVEGIPSTAYPTPAKRPSNSCLSTGKLAREYGISPRPWQDAIAEIVNDLHAERDVT